MFSTTLVFTFISLWTFSVGQVTLTQPASESATPGNTVTLPCTLNGYSISDRYVYWYQQKDANKPRYLLYFKSDSEKHHGNGVPERFSGSKDTSKNTGYLTMKGVLLEDDADYYCAIWHPPSSTWMFGKGTQLSVLTGEVKAPSVFLYKPSEEELKTDKATVVCTLTDFTPRNVQVDWIVDGTKQTTGIFPSLTNKQDNNLYMKSSLLTMTSAEYKNKQKIACKVTHEGKEIIQTLNRSECT